MKNILIHRLYLALLLFTVFFLYFFVPTMSLIALVVIGIFGLFINKPRFSKDISPNIAFFLFLSSIFIIDNLRAFFIYEKGTIIFFLILSIFCIYLTLSYSTNHDFNIIKKLLITIVAIHALAIYIQLLFPAFYRNQILPYIPENMSKAYLKLEYRGLTGITTQTGESGFIMALGISILICQSLIKPITFSNVTTFLYFLVSLLLTNKRGYLLCAFFPLILMLPFYAYKTRKLKKVTSIMAGLTTIPTIIILFFYDSLKILDRVFGENVTTSGRINLYNIVIDNINLPFGDGFLSFQYVYEVHPHNMFLQLLYEDGLLGLIIFMIFIIYTLFFTLKNFSFFNESLVWSLYIQIFCLIHCCTGYGYFLWNMTIIYVIAWVLPFNKAINNTIPIQTKNQLKE